MLALRIFRKKNPQEKRLEKKSIGEGERVYCMYPSSGCGHLEVKTDH